MNKFCNKEVTSYKFITISWDSTVFWDYCCFFQSLFWQIAWSLNILLISETRTSRSKNSLLITSNGIVESRNMYNCISLMTDTYKYQFYKQIYFLIWNITKRYQLFGRSIQTVKGKNSRKVIRLVELVPSDNISILQTYFVLYWVNNVIKRYYSSSRQ